MSVIYGNPITLGGGGVKGKKLSELTEGSLVSVLEDGKLVPFYVAKHNYEADLNGEGRTLLVRKDIHSKVYWEKSDVNNYAISDIDAWLNGDYKALLSGTVLSAIGVTTFEYDLASGSHTKTTLQRSVFLLSMTELGLAPSSSLVLGEATPIASALRIAYLNGTASDQFTRTAHTADFRSLWWVTEAGVASDIGGANSSRGARPCFTLPADMALNTEPYADGSWGLADEDVLFDTTTAKTTPLVPVNYTNGISDFTPAQISEIAKAISANPNITKDTGVVYYDKGDVHRKISTGDTMVFTYNDDKLYTYTARIAGFNHDDLSAGGGYETATITGKAGMTFEMVDCLESTYPMNSSSTNNGGWATSVMRTTYLPVFIGRFTNEMQDAFKTVIKLTSTGNRSSGVTATEDKLFSPSEVEVFGTTTVSAAGEGSQYAYYKAGNSKLKNLKGSATNWWERSPRVDSINMFGYVDTNGSANSTLANNAVGVSLFYCI